MLFYSRSKNGYNFQTRTFYLHLKYSDGGYDIIGSKEAKMWTPDDRITCFFLNGKMPHYSIHKIAASIIVGFTVLNFTFIILGGSFRLLDSSHGQVANRR